MFRAAESAAKWSMTLRALAESDDVSAARQTPQNEEANPLRERMTFCAAKAAAEWSASLRATGAADAPVLILAGPGNNGGDALMTATLLRRAGVAVMVVFNRRGVNLPPDAEAACQQFIAGGGKFLTDIPENQRFSLIVDGLFGIGLTRAPEDAHAELIRTANRLARAQNCPLLALDCPSGLCADTGFAYQPTIHATHTLAFIGAKPGLYTADGPDYCGDIRIDPLGLNADAADGKLLGVSSFAACLRARKNNTHKGLYGGVGILGGATAMQGAALLAGRAALCLGAGRVYIGMLDAKSVDFMQPELMLRQGARLFDARLDALVCGPGMGTVGQARELLLRALSLRSALVLDADALNLVAAMPALAERLESETALREAAGGSTILTPHPAEAARLLAVTVEDVQENRVESALALARKYQAWVLLKGCGSVIAHADQRWWINPTGHPGMAGPGFGDVLSGFIAALLGQGFPAGEALMAATYLHGLAAEDCAARGIGPVGLTAGEVIPAARARFNRWLARDFSS